MRQGLKAFVFGTAIRQGFTASRENLERGTSPLRRSFSFVFQTHPTTLSPAVTSFVDGPKGPDGQKVIASR